MSIARSGTTDACLSVMTPAKPERYAQIGAILLVAEAVFAVTHLAIGKGYHGFVFLHSVVIDVGLTVVWLVGAASLLIRRFLGAAFFSALAALVSLIHGAFLSLAAPHTGAGVPFMVAGIVIAACMRLSRGTWDFRRSSSAAV